MPDKFIKDIIYVIIGILLVIFVAIQPYNLFCKIKGTCHPIIISSILPHKLGQKNSTVNFSAQLSDELKNEIIIYPQEKVLNVINGRNINNFFIIKNLTSKPINIKIEAQIEPIQANQYLKRIECLCFKKHSLNAGEVKSVPVSFRINPEIEKSDIAEVNINYIVE